MTIEERNDLKAACEHAQRNPQPKGVLPHYLRCDWMRGDWDDPGPKQRCRLADGHAGEHTYG